MDMMNDKKLEEYLSKISSGLTPEMVQLKSQELQEEYEKLLEDQRSNYLNAADECEMTKEQEFMIYQSWVGHKLAAFEILLNHIVRVLNAAED